jgi:hypothetical protein
VDLPATQNDGGNIEDRDQSIPQEFHVKKDSTKDLLTVFSDIKTVTFKNGDKMETPVRGRWCLLCKYVTQKNLLSDNETYPKFWNVEAMRRS